MRVAVTTELPAPIERCYEFVTDPARLQEWVTVHERVLEAPPRPLRAGAEMVQQLRVAGRPVVVHWRAIRVEPPTLVEWEGTGPLHARARVIYRFSSTESGRTHFDYVNEYELPGGPLGRLAGKTVAMLARREAEASLERLRRLLKTAK